MKSSEWAFVEDEYWTWIRTKCDERERNQGMQLELSIMEKAFTISTRTSSLMAINRPQNKSSLLSEISSLQS